MRKHATTLLAPLAALAIAGTVGTAPAQAHGDQSSGHGDHSGGDHGDTRSAEIVTDEDAAATLEEAGVTLAAVDPATAEEQEDGTTELTFPQAGEGDAKSTSEDEVDFLGGIEYSSDADTATWADPSLDTSDWLVSFEVDGERTGLLQVVPEDEGDDEESGEYRTSGYNHGDESDEGQGESDYDLALTAEGADALNEMAGDESFAEGDVLATTDDGKDC
jgi:hypothetical protein